MMVRLILCAMLFPLCGGCGSPNSTEDLATILDSKAKVDNEAGRELVVLCDDFANAAGNALAITFYENLYYQFDDIEKSQLTVDRASLYVEAMQYFGCDADVVAKNYLHIRNAMIEGRGNVGKALSESENQESQETPNALP